VFCKEKQSEGWRWAYLFVLAAYRGKHDVFGSANGVGGRDSKVIGYKP
jgi:hypothetical protein